jgi:transposase
MDKRSVATQEDAIKLTADFERITQIIIRFLQMFLNDTLAKRVVSMILILTGIKDDRVAAAVGLSERSIWALRKTMVSGNVDDLFDVGGGSGRPRKTRDVESAIAEELEKNNYHTRQQIADMILEKFGIVMSVSAVGRLLKKTASED